MAHRPLEMFLPQAQSQVATGIAYSNGHMAVERMLDRIQHRGPAGRVRSSRPSGATLGVVWPSYQGQAKTLLLERQIARDGESNWHLAQAEVVDGRMSLSRDHLGLAPLYYGRTTDGHLCCASEVKALLELTREIREFPPGSQGDDIGVSKRFELRNGTPPRKSPDAIAKELRRRLERAIACRIFGSSAGCWLPGGLDSSSIAAMLPTFPSSTLTSTPQTLLQNWQ